MSVERKRSRKNYAFRISHYIYNIRAGQVRPTQTHVIRSIAPNHPGEILVLVHDTTDGDANALKAIKIRRMSNLRVIQGQVWVQWSGKSIPLTTPSILSTCFLNSRARLATDISPLSAIRRRRYQLRKISSKRSGFASLKRS